MHPTGIHEVCPWFYLGLVVGKSNFLNVQGRGSALNSTSLLPLSTWITFSLSFIHPYLWDLRPGCTSQVCQPWCQEPLNLPFLLVVIRSSVSSLIAFNTSIEILIFAVHEFYINRLMDCKWKKLHVCFNLFSPTGFLMKLESLMNVVDMFYQTFSMYILSPDCCFLWPFGWRIHMCFV